MVTLDAVILRPADTGGWDILLIERGKPPFDGHWALPGGFLEMDEDLPIGASRELEEETGLSISRPMKQLGAFGHPERDPRGRTITIAYGLVLTREEGQLAVEGRDDARKAAWHSITQLPPLAFDHSDIIQTGLTVLL